MIHQRKYLQTPRPRKPQQRPDDRLPRVGIADVAARYGETTHHQQPEQGPEHAGPLRLTAGHLPGDQRDSHDPDQAEVRDHHPVQVSPDGTEQQPRQHQDHGDVDGRPDTRVQPPHPGDETPVPHLSPILVQLAAPAFSLRLGRDSCRRLGRRGYRRHGVDLGWRDPPGLLRGRSRLDRGHRHRDSRQLHSGGVVFKGQGIVSQVLSSALPPFPGTLKSV